MGNDQKDRFGDKLRDLEHAREDKFFAEREKAALAKLRLKEAETATALCPTCGEVLALGVGPRVCKNGHQTD